MSNQTLCALILAGVACLCAGGLVWWLGSATQVEFAPRLTDVAAETAAGHMGAGNEAAEKIDIEGRFQRFEEREATDSGAWPRFRGADFDNIQDETPPLADSWPEAGPRRLWSVELGEGHAGPAIWKGRVYVLDYDEELEGDTLRCFALSDGQELWRRSYAVKTKRNHGISRTIPAVNEKYIVTIGPRCQVMCVDTQTGDFRWGLDLVSEYGTEVPLWYTGQCPLLEGDTVVIAPAGKKAFMLGIDCESGKVLWETPNPKGWKMSHSSIMPMTLLGERTYVYCAIGGIAGVSAEAGRIGELRWKTHEWNNSVTSPSPVPVDEKRVFLTAGYGGGSMMLGLERKGEAIEARPIYTLDKTVFACEQQTPIFYREHLFGILPKDAKALRGQFACLRPDGELAWSSGKTERFGLGPFLVADEKIFILDDNGELTLIEASLSGYHQLARARVVRGHDAWAPMALIDGKLLLRDSRTLMCLDVAASAPTTAELERHG